MFTRHSFQIARLTGQHDFLHDAFFSAREA